MRTQEVVYVPVPENLEERRKDTAVQNTLKMLIRNKFRLQAILRLRDGLGDYITVECWTKK